MAKQNGNVADPTVDPSKKIVATLDNVDTVEGFEDEQVGFPPYWRPQMTCTECEELLGEKEFKCKRHPDAELRGSRFLGTVLSREEDARNDADEDSDSFVRYVLQATRFPIPCFQGPAAESDKILAKTGEFFTCSSYASLPLDRFYGLEVLVTARSKRAIPGGKTLWKFSVKASKEVKKLLDNHRKQLTEKAQKLMLAQRAEKLASSMGVKEETEATAEA